MQLREHGKETGIAGAKVGVAAVGAVISGLESDEAEPTAPESQPAEEVPLQI